MTSEEIKERMKVIDNKISVLKNLVNSRSVRSQITTLRLEQNKNIKRLEEAEKLEAE